MLDIKEKLIKIKTKFEEVSSTFDVVGKKKQLEDLEKKTVNPDLWKDADKARNLMQDIGNIKKEIEEIERLKDDIDTLFELLQAQPDSYNQEIKDIQLRLNKFVITAFLSEPYDGKNAIVSIHAGQGGTEAMDWANMLYRMYLRYCEKRGWRILPIDVSEGEEAGIKSTTFKVEGVYAYGYLKGESGTHRLVRQSPFNADNLRQTSFASVGVLPELADVDLPDIKIKDEDLEWQFFRSSSQGGQNVQKVSTAVRVKHKPTGIIATAQTERFQEQNRKNAIDLLRARIWALKKEDHKRKVSKIKGEYKPASWGMQIRSYVLHPYKMVKDLRTGVETSDTESVLDGKLDEFIEAEIQKGD